MSYNLENNKNNRALLLSHVPNFARFSLYYNQKAAEHCSFKKWAIGSLQTPYPRLQSGTCRDDRVAEFFPRLQHVPEVYGRVCRPVPGLLGHTVTPLVRICPIFESQESVDSTILWQRGSQDCTESPFSYCSGRSS